MIGLLAWVFSVVISAVPSATTNPGPSISKSQMAELKKRVGDRFHIVNDQLGPRAFYLFSVSRDGTGLILNVRKMLWEAAPEDRRKAVVAETQAWWKTNCVDPRKKCVVGIYDDKGGIILAAPGQTKTIKTSPQPSATPKH